MNQTNNLEKHGETLKVTDLVKFAKEMDLKYITAATFYNEEGLECKVSVDKSKSEKWKELKKKWKSK